jgi:hypothetical protein
MRTLRKTKRETSTFHGIPISSLIEKKINCAKMAMVDDFVANGILMFSLMEPKTIPTKMRMVDDYQVKGLGVY